MNETVKILLSFVCAFLLAFLSTPFVKKLAKKIGAIDIPKDKRRMHTDSVPLIGGLAIFLGFLVSTVFFAEIDIKIIAILSGALLMVVLGVFDD